MIKIITLTKQPTESSSRDVPPSPPAGAPKIVKGVRTAAHKGVRVGDVVLLRQGKKKSRLTVIGLARVPQ